MKKLTLAVGVSAKDSSVPAHLGDGMIFTPWNKGEERSSLVISSGVGGMPGWYGNLGTRQACRWARPTSRCASFMAMPAMA